MSSSPNTHNLYSMDLLQFELNTTVSGTPPVGVWTSPSISDLMQAGPKLKVILRWNQLWLTEPLHILLGAANCSWGKKWRTRSLHFSLKLTLENLTWCSNNDKCQPTVTSVLLQQYFLKQLYLNCKKYSCFQAWQYRTWANRGKSNSHYTVP